MRNVETIFIVHPDLREEAVQSVVAASAGLVRSTGGEIHSLDDWGNKKLAYPIDKITRGRYFHMIYSTGENTVSELERKLRISDRVYRFLTVALEGELPVAAVADDAAEPAEGETAAQPAATPGRLGEFEGIEPDFGSGGIEHLLREPSEALDEEEEEEVDSDGRGDDDDDRRRRGARFRGLPGGRGGSGNAD